MTHHGYCLKHMEVNLYQKFKDKGLVNIMWSVPLDIQSCGARSDYGENEKGKRGGP